MFEVRPIQEVGRMFEVRPIQGYFKSRTDQREQLSGSSKPI